MPDGPASVPASGLKTRLVSAAVGIPIVLLAILAGLPGVAAISIGAALVAGYELAEMAKVGRNRSYFFIGFAALFGSAGLYAALEDSDASLSAAYTGMLIVVVANSVFAFIEARGSRGARPVSSLLFRATLIYGFFLAHGMLIVAEDDGRQWILLAILGTFAVDTGAYFTGRTVGRHKLAPKISPGKTWEGVFGGALAAVGAVIALGAVLDLPVAVWEAAILGIALTVAGVLGDLFESWLKRRANVKDSGRLIPGHGGILDRIDSLAPNLLAVYWAIQIIGN